MIECNVTKFQVGTMFTCHTVDSQMYSIGKVIRPLLISQIWSQFIMNLILLLHFGSKSYYYLSTLVICLTFMFAYNCSFLLYGMHMLTYVYTTK